MFDQQDAETIYHCLAEGKSLLSICEAIGIPYSTARQWELDNPEHAANSARARELGCHFLAEECLQIADNTLEGIETTVKADGGIEERRGDMLAHRKLQIDTRMRLIGKWAPKLYGEKVTQEHTGPGGGAIKSETVTMTAEEAYKRMLGG
jgi:hypothetical protein